MLRPVETDFFKLTQKKADILKEISIPIHFKQSKIYDDPQRFRYKKLTSK